MTSSPPSSVSVDLICAKSKTRYIGETDLKMATQMKRAFTNILSDDVGKTAGFYEKLLGMIRHFESDWFVILTHPGIPGLEYGILQKDHETVPEEGRTAAGGTIITFVVEDCDKTHAIAREMKAGIVSEPTDMPYGQRRMLVRDPDGTLIDVSAPTAPAPET